MYCIINFLKMLFCYIWLLLGSSTSRKWPQGQGDYCQFVLYKENKDTMEAVGQISRTLKIKSSNFHYAGTKDRRAVTSQLLTAFR